MYNKDHLGFNGWPKERMKLNSGKYIPTKKQTKKLFGIYLVGLDGVIDEGVAVETAETVHGVVDRVEADAAQLAVLTL